MVGEAVLGMVAIRLRSCTKAATWCLREGQSCKHGARPALHCPAGQPCLLGEAKQARFCILGCGPPSRAILHPKPRHPLAAANHAARTHALPPSKAWQDAAGV